MFSTQLGVYFNFKRISKIINPSKMKVKQVLNSFGQNTRQVDTKLEIVEYNRTINHTLIKENSQLSLLTAEVKKTSPNSVYLCILFIKNRMHCADVISYVCNISPTHLN